MSDILGIVRVILGLVDRLLLSRQARGGMSFVLRFEGVGQGENISLISGECKTSDPRNPVNERSYRLRPYRGGGGQGWICTLPRGVDHNDSVVLNFTDASGGQWRTEPFVPALELPTIQIRRLS